MAGGPGGFTWGSCGGKNGVDGQCVVLSRRFFVDPRWPSEDGTGILEAASGVEGAGPSDPFFLPDYLHSPSCP